MRVSAFQPLRVIALVLAVEVAHLGWEALHGGIVTHHPLARPDLPGVSNGWGLLVAPCLAIWALGCWRRRGAIPRQVAAGLLGGLGAGVTLSLFFHWGTEAMTSATLGAVLVAALMLPVYRAECLLGFVMSMSWTFGAVIPLLVGGLILVMSALVHRVLYRGVRLGWRRYRHGTW